MRRLSVWVSPICEHHALNAGRGCIGAVLEEQWLVIFTCLDHEVPVFLLDLIEILFDGLFCDFFLSIDNLANVGAPDSKSEGNNEVEESDVADEPPVERWDLSAAWVVDTTPEFQLAEEETSADEKVEAKE